jgi:HEAT repeat protein
MQGGTSGCGVRALDPLRSVSTGMWNIPAEAIRTSTLTVSSITGSHMKAVSKTGSAKTATLGSILKEADGDLLLWELERGRPDVQAKVCFELGRRTFKPAMVSLRKLLASPSDEVRAAAAEALGKIGDPRAGGDLMTLLIDPSQPSAVRDTCAYALGRIRYAPAIQALSRALADTNPSVRICAAAALTAIEGANAYDRLNFAARLERDPRAQAIMTRALRCLRRPSLELAPGGLTANSAPQPRGRANRTTYWTRLAHAGQPTQFRWAAFQIVRPTLASPRAVANARSR